MGWAVALQRTMGRRVVLVGLSGGALLALATLLSGTPVDGLVLMSTPLQYDGWGVSRWQPLLPLALYTPLGRLWQYRERAPYGVKNPRVRRWVERELQVGLGGDDVRLGLPDVLGAGITATPTIARLLLAELGFLQEGPSGAKLSLELAARRAGQRRLDRVDVGLGQGDV